MRGFIAGALLGAIAGAGALLYWVETQASEDLMFPQYLFVDGGNWVSFAGSLIGDDPANQPINNHYDVMCWQDRMECRVASIDQISENFAGGIDMDTVRIRSWTDDFVVADSRDKAEALEACNWYQIRINRKTEKVDYIRTPIKAAYEKEDGLCNRFSEERVFRWYFGDGRAWRKWDDLEEDAPAP